MAKYKIEVDEATCIGCGACAATAPDLFEMSGDNKAKAISTETDSESAKAAAEACPVDAI
ncbi:MAG: ferredoxin, partial [Candidatus Woesearchaeota archaeon]